MNEQTINRRLCPWQVKFRQVITNLREVDNFTIRTEHLHGIDRIETFDFARRADNFKGRFKQARVGGKYVLNAHFNRGPVIRVQRDEILRNIVFS